MNTAKTARGFTLLEMLIGLTLVGFILALLFAGLRLGSRSWDAGEQRMTASVERSLVVNFIRHTLEQAYPLSWKVDGEDTLAFSGQNEALSFVGPVSSREGLSGNHLITLKLVEGDSGSDLVMQWHLPDPQEHGFDLLAESKPKILVRQVRAMTLDYFGADNDVNEPSWHAQWPSTQQLPRLIRLRLELENSEAWPDIVVAPLRAGERATPGNPPVQGEPQFGPLPG